MFDFEDPKVQATFVAALDGEIARIKAALEGVAVLEKRLVLIEQIQTNWKEQFIHIGHYGLIKELMGTAPPVVAEPPAPAKRARIGQTDPNSDAFKRGKAAAEKGVAESANEFTVGTVRHQGWLLGHRSVIKVPEGPVINAAAVGRQAFMNGVSSNDNPYLVGTEDFADWRHSWHLAKDEAAAVKPVDQMPGRDADA